MCVILNIDNNNGNNNGHESEYVSSENESILLNMNDVSLHKKSTIRNSVSSQSNLDTLKVNVMIISVYNEVMYVQNINFKQDCCVFYLQFVWHLLTVQ